MLDFRQRLLATSFLVGASMVAFPALAQNTQQHKPLCPPGAPSPDANCTPQDSATAAQPATMTPQQGQTTGSSTNAQGAPVRAAQEIVVTGTRIPQPNLVSASPVTVVTSQEIKLEGTTRTEDLINSLPQVMAAQGSNVSNGSTGAATLNLRGLGQTRTLVLIDGRRLMPGDPQPPNSGGEPVADINFIPSALIKRVDVLTGGASSTYGADAVAGVVNFIMDTDYRGLRIDAQTSTFMHNNRAGPDILNANAALDFRPPHGMNVNGGAQDIAAVFGTGFADGRGSIEAYATYRTQDAVLESTRDYSFCTLGANYAQDVPQYGLFYCGGSSTSAPGTFRVSTLNPITGKVKLAPFHVEGNEFLPGIVLFNFAPYNYFQRPDERYTLGTFADYEISPAMHPYLEAMFMHDHTDAVIAPSGTFNFVQTVACDNALLSAQQVQILCTANPSGTPVTFTGPLNGMADVLQSKVRIARRNVEGGGRDATFDHSDYRIVGGIRGELARGLSYDAYYQYGTARYSQVFNNDFSVARLLKATDVIAVLNGKQVPAGTPGATFECRATFTGLDPNCVPYNIFQTGGVTQAALNYVQVPGFQNGYTAETVADANMTLEGGEYGIKSPWSDRGVGANVGVEYRKEALQFNTDVEYQAGDLAGGGGPVLPVSGSYNVREAFAEVQIPIITHSFIDDFTINGGYRYSNYHAAANQFNTSTYKIEAQLAPVRDIKLRAGYNRAVRAPNVVELFAPQTRALQTGNDICGGDTPTATLAQCMNTGVTAAQYGAIAKNPATQYNAILGGNPSLQPETADTWTAGAVLQPRWIPGLALSADYFNIKVKKVISFLPWQGVLNACALTGAPNLCALIHRDPAGSLWLDITGYITLVNQNIGGLQTRGIDLQGTYSRRIGGMGTLNVSFVGTYMKNLITDTGVNTGAPGLNGVYECAGLFGNTCGTPNPKWRHKLRVGFTLPTGIGISGQWRYFSGVTQDIFSNDCDLGTNLAGGPNHCAALTSDPLFQPANARIPAVSYFDLVLTARIANHFNLRLGANNIFDRSPPISPLGANGNTYPQVYDALGRFLFAGVTVDF